MNNFSSFFSSTHASNLCHPFLLFLQLTPLFLFSSSQSLLPPYHSVLCSTSVVFHQCCVLYLSVFLFFAGSSLFSPPLHILLPFPSPSPFSPLCSSITSFHLSTLPQFFILLKSLTFLHTTFTLGMVVIALIQSHFFPLYTQLLYINFEPKNISICCWSNMQTICLQQSKLLHSRNAMDTYFANHKYSSLISNITTFCILLFYMYFWGFIIVNFI